MRKRKRCPTDLEGPPLVRHSTQSPTALSSYPSPETAEVCPSKRAKSEPTSAVSKARVTIYAWVAYQLTFVLFQDAQVNANRSQGPTELRRVPLTSSNLDAFSFAMSGPQSPPQTQTQTESRSSRKTNTKGGLLQMRDFLQYNSIFVDDEAVMGQRCYQDTMAEVRRIVRERERFSPEHEADAETLVANVKKFASMLEPAFLQYSWPRWWERTRTIKIPEKGSEPQLVSRTWISDNVLSNPNAEFTRGSVPKLLPAGTDQEAKEQAQRLLRINPKIKNPKPDDVLAYDKDTFSREEFNAIPNFPNEAGISPGVYFPGMIMEGKSNGGNIDEAVEQCARGGAALVGATRRVLQYVDPYLLSRPVDFRSMVFSVAFLPTCIQLSVHWAYYDRVSENTEYHMHNIEDFFPRSVDSSKTFFRRISNILDWIAFDRKKQIKEVLALVTHRQQLPPPSPSHNASLHGENGTDREENEMEAQVGKRRRLD